MEKQEGDVVNEGDVLLEMMSDKTSMELEAEESGVLLKIVHGNGATVPVTEVIAYIGAEGETVEADSAPAVEPAAPLKKYQQVARLLSLLLQWQLNHKVAARCVQLQRHVLAGELH